MTQRPNTIPCPRAYAEDRPCGEMTPDGRLCRQCESRLRHSLKELPDLWRHLQLTRTRQARTGTSGQRGSEDPLPFSFDASWDSDAIIMTLHTWIRDLQETYGISTDPGSDMTSWCSWLTGQMHHIRNHPAVDQLWDELTEPARVIKRTVDQPAEQTYVCVCAICSARVFGPEWADEVECRRCREVADRDGEGYVPAYSRMEEEDHKRELLRDSVVMVGELRSAVLHTEGIRVNRKTLHSWVTRERLKPMACRAYTWVNTDEGLRLRPTWTHRKDGVTHTQQYRVSDAVLLAQDIPLRDLQVDEVKVDDREEQDHDAAYLKVLRVIATAKGEVA